MDGRDSIVIVVLYVVIVVDIVIEQEHDFSRDVVNIVMEQEGHFSSSKIDQVRERTSSRVYTRPEHKISHRKLSEYSL